MIDDIEFWLLSLPVIRTIKSCVNDQIQATVDVKYRAAEKVQFHLSTVATISPNPINKIIFLGHNNHNPNPDYYSNILSAAHSDLLGLTRRE